MGKHIPPWILEKLVSAKIKFPTFYGIKTVTVFISAHPAADLFLRKMNPVQSLTL
jgi:hypothetical protein